MKKNDFRRYDKLQKQMEKAGDVVVKVGILGGKLRQGEDFTEAELGAVHEFGSPTRNIPARPFMRPTFENKKDEFEKLLGRAAEKIIDGKVTVEQALNIVGMAGANEVKKTITAGAPLKPPLKKATIKRKKSSRPLVNTGRLVNSISWEVGRDAD